MSGIWSVALHTFLDQHQYRLFFPLANDFDAKHLSAKQYHQLQSFESSFLVSTLLEDTGEFAFSICSKILLQHVLHIDILFLSMHLLTVMPDGSMTVIIFMVRELLGESGVSLFESPMVSTVSLMIYTVSDIELMISSTSAINVLSYSSFKELLFIFKNPAKIVLADRLWCSQISPI